MSQPPGTVPSPGISPRAAELFLSQQRKVYQRIDRIFAVLLIFEWLFGIAISLIISPRAWAGTTSYVHQHVWFAILLGGIICLIPAMVAFWMPGQTMTRHIVAVGQMLMSAVLIHLTGGRIETHFHIFGSLAFLAFYRDWRVVITATVVVALDHFLRGVFWPQSVYGVLNGVEWRWLEHVGWVIFEDVFLIMSCVQGTGDMRAAAVREADLDHANRLLNRAYDTTIEGWSRALDLRDNETEGHSQRVTDIALQLAACVGISDEDMIHLRRGALLHDIGKMGIPDNILLKPGSLTDEEWDVMRQHPDAAYALLLPIEFLHPALDIPYNHHEKWDGSGYPRGLKGEEIPLSARVFAIVDVWDALRSRRPYRNGWPDDKVRQYIRDEAGKHFDPQLVVTFLDMTSASESNATVNDKYSLQEAA